MGRDNSPENRRIRKLERKQAAFQKFDRILIVSEGSKTEPNYLREIMRCYRVPSATYCILPSQYGTSPKQVVEFARDIFLYGDPRQRIKPRSFERIYALFDRDEHKSYHDALKLSENFIHTPLINDMDEKVLFRAIASVPNFELWLLSHYKLVREPISRKEVVRELKKYIKNYEKGQKGYFDLTKHLLEVAFKNIAILVKNTNAFDGNMPYSDMGGLVKFLVNIKS